MTIRNDPLAKRDARLPDTASVRPEQARATPAPAPLIDPGRAVEALGESVGEHVAATTSRQGNPAHGGQQLVHHATALRELPTLHIDELLAFVVKAGASDLHLSPGKPPMLRLHGEIRRFSLPPLEHRDIHRLVYDVMNNEQRKTYERDKELDFAFEMPGHGRFRVNVLVESGGIGAVFRAVPTRVPTLAEIGAPSVLEKLAELPRGLVLVTGATGSGKSTTLAAMIEHRIRNASSHVITIEDPIEFVHQSPTEVAGSKRASLVRQRELGPHTDSFPSALRSALREDPNVIMVGEMRDVDTIRLALTAAETGALVLSTLHTASAPKTVDRILDVFPAEEKEHARTMLSDSLAAVVSQTLVPRADGKGRVAAHEVMVVNPAIRNLIRENKIAQLVSAIQTSRDLGNQTLDHALEALVRDRVITAAEAQAKAPGRDFKKA